jgi:cell division protein FtsB
MSDKPEWWTGTLDKLADQSATQIHELQARVKTLTKENEDLTTEVRELREEVFDLRAEKEARRSHG